MVSFWYNKAKSQYCTDLTVEGRRRRVFLGADGAKAKKAFMDLQRQLAETSGAVPISLVSLAELFLEYVKANKAAGTYDQYVLMLSKFVAPRQDLLAEDIKARDLEAAKQAYVATGASTASANHLIKVVKTMFNWGLKREYVSKNPVLSVEKFPKTPPPTRVLTQEEEIRLMAAADREMRAILTVFLRTGLRLSELTGLTWDRIDLGQKIMTIVERKTTHTVTNPTPLVVPLHADVLAVLISRRRKTGLVFANGNGTAYTKDSLRRRFNTLKKRAKVEGVTIHTLRHTVATRLVQAGVSLSTVARLLGHSSQHMTARYSHLNVEDVRAALDKLSGPEPEGKVLKLNVG